jgi:hypothetical protein
MHRGKLSASEITLVTTSALCGSRFGKKLCAELFDKQTRHTTAELPLEGLITWHRHPPLAVRARLRERRERARERARERERS